MVRVQAAYSKNGRADEIPLHTTVVERLRAWLKAKGDIEPGEPLICLQTSGGNWRRPSKMMFHDLGVARETWIDEADTDLEKKRRLKSSFLKYQDDDGLFADFHSNRHTFISNLGRAGVPLATAQKLARHSTPTLTSNTYTHLELSDKAAAIELLPNLAQNSNPEAEPQTLLATGTDDELPVSNYESLATPLPQPCQNGVISGHFDARADTTGKEEGAAQETQKPHKIQGLGACGHNLTGVETSGLEPPTPGLQSRCSPN